jgi:phosphonate degradation associated HDIG domain protein
MASAADQIRALFAETGEQDYVGEAVSQLAHATQAAHHAARCGEPEEVVIAALLHDVGHMLGLRNPSAYERMEDCGVMRHEHVGADWLAGLGLPNRTSELVRLHVQAKRFLCWKDLGYLSRLSPASVTTLGYQGGPMSDAEAAAFSANPNATTILRLRTWDEAAKVPGMEVPGLEAYLGISDRLGEGARGGAEAK